MALDQPIPRRVGPSFLVKAIVTLLVLVTVAFLYAIANPKFGIMLGIFGEDGPADRIENTIAAALGAAISSLVLLYQIILYRREKYLMSQGTPAPAIYTGYYEYIRQSQYEYSLKKQQTGRVTYAFKDSSGELIQGEKSGIQSQNDLRPESAKLADLNNENPFVLFDPRNGARHMIYPGSLTKFV